MSIPHEQSTTDKANSAELDEAAYWGSFSVWKDRSRDVRGSDLNTSGENPSPELRPIECIVLGPAGSGKSSWISALGQSMVLPREDPRALRIIPRDRGVVLEGLGVEAIARGRALDTSALGVSGRPASLEHVGARDRFVFDIGPVTPVGRLRRVTFIERSLAGSDSGFVEKSDFPTLSLAPRTVRCLVLCLDGSSNQTAFWHSLLPMLLDHLTRLPENDLDRRDPHEQGTAPFDRVLFSVNKIDVPCRAVLEISDQERALLRARGLSWTSGKEVAECLDPLRTVTQQFGEAGRKRLDSITRRSTPIAAGVTSAHGFDLDKPSNCSNGAGQNLESLLTWRPYGLLDALRFITTGKIAGSLRSIISSR